MGLPLLPTHPSEHSQTTNAHGRTSLFRSAFNCMDLLFKVLTNGKLFVQKDFMTHIKCQLQF